MGAPLILLLAGNASIWTGPTGNNTFLLPGAAPALVDAGVGDPEHIASIAAALGDSVLDTILITHGHSDHTGGLPALGARWPGAKVVRFPETTDGSDTVAVGDSGVRAVHTPGHSPDHLCFFDEADGDLFCGDLVRERGTIVIPASRGGNLRLYLQSLRRVREMAPRRLLPGHGPIVDDPAALIDRYLRHRAEREVQVMGALRAGASTPDAVAEIVYGPLASGLRAAAADTILAHLIKLEEEGRATSIDGRWRAV